MSVEEVEGLVQETVKVAEGRPVGPSVSLVLPDSNSAPKAPPCHAGLAKISAYVGALLKSRRFIEMSAYYKNVGVLLKFWLTSKISMHF